MDNQEKNKKKFYKRWWFWAIVVFVLIVIGSSGGNKSDNSNVTPTGTSEKPAQQTVARLEATIKVTAPQLLSEYEANEVAADAKYKNKVIEVSGSINTIGKDILDTPYVSLNSNSPSLIFNVQCMFGKGDQAQLAALSKDTNIVLKGKVSGKLGNILINDCSIVK